MHLAPPAAFALPFAAWTEPFYLPALIPAGHLECSLPEGLDSVCWRALTPSVLISIDADVNVLKVAQKAVVVMRFKTLVNNVLATPEYTVRS